MGLIDLIFPKSCLSCGRVGKYICSDCLSKAESINKFDPYTKTFSIFRYKGIIKKAIIKLKYSFAFDISKELSEICIQNLKGQKIMNSLKNVVLLPIPLHSRRQNWRGFNQAEILGKLISKGMNWGFENNILIRPVASTPQVGLPRSVRVRNISGKFAVNLEAKKKLKNNSTFIVFDDVFTTGSTIREGIKILKEESLQKVVGLTIAR